MWETQALLSETLRYNDTAVRARPLPTCSSRWPRATRRRPPRPTPPANELERLPQLRRDNRPCDTYVRTTCPSSRQSKRDAILVRHPGISSASSSTPRAVPATYTTTIITSTTLAATTAASIASFPPPGPPLPDGSPAKQAQDRDQGFQIKNYLHIGEASPHDHLHHSSFFLHRHHSHFSNISFLTLIYFFVLCRQCRLNGHRCWITPF